MIAHLDDPRYSTLVQKVETLVAEVEWLRKELAMTRSALRMSQRTLANGFTNDTEMIKSFKNN